MNRVIMNGFLVKDIGVRATTNSLIANFCIANKDGFGDYEHTSFINCTMFGEKRINALEQYLVKGCKVLIEGTWKQDSYDGKDGNKVYTHELVVDNLEIERFVEDEEEEEEEEVKPKKNSTRKNNKRR